MFEASRTPIFGLRLAQDRERELRQAWREANAKHVHRPSAERPEASRAVPARVIVGGVVVRVGEAVANLGRAVSGAKAA